MVWLYCYHIIESCLLHLKQDFKTLVYLVTPHGCVCSFFPTSTMQHSFLYIFDVIATSLLSLFSEFHFELSGCLNTHCHSHAIHAIRAILCRVQASLSSLPCPQERENLPNGPLNRSTFGGHLLGNAVPPWLAIIYFSLFHLALPYSRIVGMKTYR